MLRPATDIPPDPASEPPSTLRTARRIVIAVAGGTLMLIGVALLVLPGPGVLVVAAGFSVLATEFVWARQFLRKARETVTRWKPGQPRTDS